MPAKSTATATVSVSLAELAELRSMLGTVRDELATLEAERDDLADLCRQWRRNYLEMRGLYEAAFLTLAGNGDRHAAKFLALIAADRFAPPKEATP